MYELNSRVRYSETDIDAKLSLTGIMNYMQGKDFFIWMIYNCHRSHLVLFFILLDGKRRRGFYPPGRS